MHVRFSDLDMLKPVVAMGKGCQSEVVFGCHPGLQDLQLGGGSVICHMTYQVSLKLVQQEVEVD